MDFQLLLPNDKDENLLKMFEDLGYLQVLFVPTFICMFPKLIAISKSLWYFHAITCLTVAINISISCHKFCGYAL